MSIVPLFYILMHGNALRVIMQTSQIVNVQEVPDEIIQKFTFDQLAITPFKHGDGVNALRHEMEELGLQSIQLVKKRSLVEANKHRRPITFVHEHKAAGSLICAMAWRAGERIVSPSANCNEKSGFVNDDYHVRAAQYLPVRKRQPTCAERFSHMTLAGFTFSAIERELVEGDLCPDEFHIVAFMREPLQRLESLMNFGEFQHQALNSYVPQGIITCIQQGGCKDYTEWEHFDNYFVRTMGGASAMRAPPGGIVQEHFEAAQAMMKKVHVMAPLECLFAGEKNSGYQDLHNKFLDVVGWDIEVSKKVNASPHVKQFTSKQIASLRELNRFDLKLYSELQAIYKC